MTDFYSQKTGGFYTDSIHKTMPDDVVALKEGAKQRLMEDQAAGKRIVADANGVPVARDYVVDPDAVERKWRNLELARSDIELSKVQDGAPKSIGTVSAWRAYRNLLRAYPDSDGYPNTERPVSPT